MISLFHTPFILASASPRRKELLRLIGLKFKIMPANIDENYIPGEAPQKHVKRLSVCKASAIARKYPKHWILAADTIVVIDGTILGKPANSSQAYTMLKKLSGREHIVYTGFTIAQENTGISKTKVVYSMVRFKKIPHAERIWYINSDEPYDKAGGYAVQGKGASFIASIRGSYTNVIGLPLCEVVEMLKELQIIRFGEPPCRQISELTS